MASSQNNQGGKQNGDASNRGFASMDEDKQREIASQGGKAAHERGNAHEFSSAEAREAGSKSHGGQGSQGNQGNQGGQGGGKANEGGGSSSQSSSGTRGGTSKQHAEAGRQSHKNDKS